MYFAKAKKFYFNFYIVLIFLFFNFALTACSNKNGTILIIENKDATGFSVQMDEYSSKKKCVLSLKEGDVIQVEVINEGGIIGLTVIGKNENEPYTGNDLKTGLFTFRILETDEYTFWFKGSSATGNIIIKNLGNNDV